MITLTDRHGHPLSSPGLSFEDEDDSAFSALALDGSGIAAANDSSSRGYVWFPNLTGKYQFKGCTRTEARRRSQWAAWNVPAARKATRDLARWVGNVTLAPATRDEDFNTKVAEWKRETYELRPGNFDASRKFTEGGWMINALFSTFRDGDLLGIHGTADDGSPVAIAIESALIDNPLAGYTDPAWIDGVRTGSHYEALEYYIRPEQDLFRYQLQGTPIDAAQCHLFANYETHSAARGTPALIHAIPQIIDLREIDNDVRKILKVHGLFGLMFTRELGATADVVNPISGKTRRDNLAGSGTQTTAAAGAPSNIPRNVNEVFDNGEIHQLPPGFKAETINDGREFPTQAAVKADIYHQIAMGLGVPVELLFLLDKLTGPGVRFVLRQAQEWRNHWLDQQVAWLTIDYVRRLEWAIRTKQVPRCKDPLWYRHVVNYPRAITIDEGRDAKAIIDRLEAGLTNWATEYGEQGEQWKAQVRQRIMEIKWAEDECKTAGVHSERLFPPRKGPPDTSDQNARLERMESLILRIEERLNERAAA